MGYRVINGRLHHVQDFTAYSPEPKEKNQGTSTTQESFQTLLQKEMDKKNSFTLSNHAAQRLTNRNIHFTTEDMQKINEGINKANEKGAKECLILYKDVALITSIKNRTIITAVDKESSKENVFTNIDSVVML